MDLQKNYNPLGVMNDIILKIYGCFITDETELEFATLELTEYGIGTNLVEYASLSTKKSNELEFRHDNSASSNSL